MKTYPVDLRERAVRAVAAGHARKEVVRLYQISSASLNRWLKQASLGEDLAPRARLGAPRRVTAEQEAALQAQVQAHPDATLEEHLALWRAQGHQLSRATLDRAIKRLNYSHKKVFERLCSADLCAENGAGDKHRVIGKRISPSSARFRSTIGKQ